MAQKRARQHSIELLLGARGETHIYTKRSVTVRLIEYYVLCDKFGCLLCALRLARARPRWCY